ncbi:MAG: ornithine carbamoyltransferase [Acidimicrobiaceae bacterium]|nr:ornithine carbamoyltransferase [Acidimicrobiaceae bacterium]
MKHFLEIDDLSKEEILEVLELSRVLSPPKVLSDVSVGLVFEKPSLRTRNSCESAIFQLGGLPVSMVSGEVGLDKRESAEDVARTLASYHGYIGARVFAHSTLQRMASALDSSGSDTGIINLLSDASHPCQALADLATIQSHFGFQPGLKVAYVGDSNNVTRSLAIGCLMMGMDVSISSPTDYGFSRAERERLRLIGNVGFFTDPQQGIAGADVVYTDVWTSMGQEEERQQRLSDFAEFTVDSVLMSKARRGAIVMHCLPAHEGEEISREVLESKASVVWEQAQNRMHVMRGLFLFMSGVRPRS